MKQAIIDDVISQMFAETCRVYDLSSGDISPLDDMRIEQIKEELNEILTRFINENV